mmetsp:Transcript_140761/g.449978  ORF Transcript_140761/g.449978 Transcript_140761/m.449978 type:complete len:599 (+) Transcript_140761:45-1841(+)
MQLFVRHIKSHVVNIDASKHVRDLKNEGLLVMGVSSLPVGVHVSLQHAGHSLEDDAKLSDCGLQDDDTLYFSFVRSSVLPLTALRVVSDGISKSGKATELDLKMIDKCPSTFSALALKRCMFDRWGSDYSPEDVVIRFDGRILLDDDVLGNEGVRPGSKLEVLFSTVEFGVVLDSPLIIDGHQQGIKRKMTCWRADTVREVKRRLVPGASADDIVLQDCGGSELDDQKTLGEEALVMQGATLKLKLSSRLEWLEGTLEALHANSSNIKDGTLLKAVQKVALWSSPSACEVLGKVSLGQHVFAAGPPQHVDEWLMVPIRPRGAVQLDLMRTCERQPLPLDVCRQLLSNLPHCNRYTQYRVSDMDSSCHVAIILESLVLTSLTSHRLRLGSMKMCESPRILVEKIEQVFNPRLLEKYILELQHMTGLSRGGCETVLPPDHPLLLEPACGVQMNECLLFHGGKDADLDRICQAGFDPRLGGQSTGRLFGRGTYFAENFSKADLYAGSRPFGKPSGTMSVLVARVALGQAYRTLVPMNDIALPPQRPGTRDPYDAVWVRPKEDGGCVDHAEYVIYKDSQAVPMYRIRYRHDESCWCSRCRAS